MNASKRILSDIVGEDGYEKLTKAIFKRGTSAVIDPLEFFLPLMVVPRALLSWLVEHVQPMKPGEIKDLPFPGKPEITIHVEKQAADQYRCEFIQRGRVIHEFEKQALPIFGAHLLTVGEDYGSFADPKPEIKAKIYASPEEREAKKKAQEEHEEHETPEEEQAEHEDSSDHSAGVIRAIMHESEIESPKQDPEQIKWMVQHANIREMTSVIGKLVDALIAKKTVGDIMDKSDPVSTKGDPQKVETTKTPEEKFKEDMKAKKLPTDTEGQFKAAVQNAQEIDKIKDTPIEDQKPPECKVVPAGEKAADATVKKDEIAPVKKRSVREALLKPYVKDLPEKVSKAGEMPGGAGMPKTQLKPLPPKGPVPPGKNPAGQAAKQAEASGKGNQKPPQTPGAHKPTNPTMHKPQAPKLPQPSSPIKPLSMKPAGMKMPSLGGMGKAEGYFRSKLGKCIKSERCHVTIEELFKSKCVHCDKPEFRQISGKPVFSPCACFVVTKSDEEGKPYNFVETLKKSDGSYNLLFNKTADPEVIRAFLLTLKSALLIKRRFGV